MRSVVTLLYMFSHNLATLNPLATALELYAVRISLQNLDKCDQLSLKC